MNPPTLIAAAARLFVMVVVFQVPSTCETGAVVTAAGAMQRATLAVVSTRTFAPATSVPDACGLKLLLWITRSQTYWTGLPSVPLTPGAAVTASWKKPATRLIAPEGPMSHWFLSFVTIPATWSFQKAGWPAATTPTAEDDVAPESSLTRRQVLPVSGS